MRNKRWLRYGLASLTLVAGGLGALLVACGDDDNVTPGPKQDSGLPDDTGTSADAPTEAATQDAGPPKAKLQLVNAATSLGPTASGALRVCYALGPAEDQLQIVQILPPLPDRAAPGAPFAGVFIGTGGNVEGTGADLSGLVLQPYIMNAEKLKERGIEKPASGPGPSCGDLFTKDAGGTMTEGVDYWKLAPIAKGTFLNDKSYILVLTGCAADATVSPATKCGPGFTAGGPGVGNLKVTVYEVDRGTTIPADKVGAQFIHASAPGDAVITQGTAIGFQPGFMKDPSDAGSASPVATSAVALGAKTELTEVANVKFDAPSDYFSANPAALLGPLPLTTIQLLTYGGNVPEGGDYRNGAAFTFIAVGDPTEDADAGGKFNTKKFHYIALPNNPPNLIYKP
jgi:hypothetical protein